MPDNNVHTFTDPSLNVSPITFNQQPAHSSFFGNEVAATSNELLYIQRANVLIDLGLSTIFNRLSLKRKADLNWEDDKQVKFAKIINFMEESSESSNVAISPQNSVNCSQSSSPCELNRNKGRKIVTRKSRRRRVVEISSFVEESVDIDKVGEVSFGVAEEAGLIMPPQSPC